MSKFPYSRYLPSSIKQSEGYLSAPFSPRYSANTYNLVTLEKDFKRELNCSKGVNDLEQRVRHIINYLGRSDYSFIRLDMKNNTINRQVIVPKILLCNHRNEGTHVSGLLSQAKAASIRNRHLSMLYHFIASISFTPEEVLRKSQIQYILITSTSHYNYYITPSGSKIKTGYAVSMIENAVQHQILNGDKTANALSKLANAITHIGHKQFPEFFLQGPETKQIKINPQPQRLLNILALQDATLSQAAKRLNLTINTVNKHMATAKLALGTNTIAGTIWRAVNEGIIDEDNL